MTNVHPYTLGSKEVYTKMNICGNESGSFSGYFIYMCELLLDYRESNSLLVSSEHDKSTVYTEDVRNKQYISSK